MAKSIIFSKESSELARVVKQLRRDAGLNQIQLAGLLGVQNSEISKLESGERRLGFIQFYRLCKATKANPGATAKRIFQAFESLRSTALQLREVSGKRGR